MFLLRLELPDRERCDQMLISAIVRTA